MLEAETDSRTISFPGSRFEGFCGLESRRYHSCPVSSLSHGAQSKKRARGFPIRSARAETVLRGGGNQGRTERK